MNYGIAIWIFVVGIMIGYLIGTFVQHRVTLPLIKELECINDFYLKIFDKFIERERENNQKLLEDFKKIRDAYEKKDPT